MLVKDFLDKATALEKDNKCNFVTDVFDGEAVFCGVENCEIEQHSNKFKQYILSDFDDKVINVMTGEV